MVILLSGVLVGQQTFAMGPHGAMSTILRSGDAAVVVSATSSGLNSSQAADCYQMTPARNCENIECALVQCGAVPVLTASVAISTKTSKVPAIVQGAEALNIAHGTLPFRPPIVS